MTMMAKHKSQLSHRCQCCCCCSRVCSRSPYLRSLVPRLITAITALMALGLVVMGTISAVCRIAYTVALPALMGQEETPGLNLICAAVALELILEFSSLLIGFIITLIAEMSFLEWARSRSMKMIEHVRRRDRHSLPSQGATSTPPRDDSLVSGNDVDRQSDEIDHAMRGLMRYSRFVDKIDSAIILTVGITCIVTVFEAYSLYKGFWEFITGSLMLFLSYFNGVALMLLILCIAARAFLALWLSARKAFASSEQKFSRMRASSSLLTHAITKILILPLSFLIAPIYFCCGHTKYFFPRSSPVVHMINKIEEFLTEIYQNHVVVKWTDTKTKAFCKYCCCSKASVIENEEERDESIESEADLKTYSYCIGPGENSWTNFQCSVAALGPSRVICIGIICSVFDALRADSTVEKGILWTLAVILFLILLSLCRCKQTKQDKSPSLRKEGVVMIASPIADPPVEQNRRARVIIAGRLADIRQFPSFGRSPANVIPAPSDLSHDADLACCYGSLHFGFIVWVSFLAIVYHHALGLQMCLLCCIVGGSWCLRKPKAVLLPCLIVSLLTLLIGFFVVMGDTIGDQVGLADKSPLWMISSTWNNKTNEQQAAAGLATHRYGTCQIIVNGASIADQCFMSYAVYKPSNVSTPAVSSWFEREGRIVVPVAECSALGLSGNDKSGLRFDAYVEVDSASEVQAVRDSCTSGFPGSDEPYFGTTRHLYFVFRGSKSMLDFGADILIWHEAFLFHLLGFVGPFASWPLKAQRNNIRFMHVLLAGYDVDEAHTDHIYYNQGFDIVSKYRRKFPNTTASLTGHSLGGGLSSIVGQGLQLPSVSFSGPGYKITAVKIAELEARMQTWGTRVFFDQDTIVVAPEYDIFPKIDYHAGTRQEIDCLDSRDPIACHDIWRTCCELRRACGDPFDRTLTECTQR